MTTLQAVCAYPSQVIRGRDLVMLRDEDGKLYTAHSYHGSIPRADSPFMVEVALLATAQAHYAEAARRGRTFTPLYEAHR